MTWTAKMLTCFLLTVCISFVVGASSSSVVEVGRLAATDRFVPSPYDNKSLLDARSSFKRLSTPVARLNASGEDGKWEAIPPPNGRMDHTVVYDSLRNRLLIFGGLRQDTGSSYLNDTWSLDLTEPLTWNMVNFLNSPPSGRIGHSAIYDPVRDRILIFGGTNDLSLFSDTWELSLSGTPMWRRLIPPSTVPPGKLTGHSVVYDPIRDQMIIFGGHDGSTSNNETWTFSLADPVTWAKLSTSGFLPPGRHGHTAIYDVLQNQMVVFGGTNDSTLFGDTWTLSLSGECKWSESVSGIFPDPRRAHVAVYDSTNHQMVIFGGFDGAYRSDSWIFPLDGSGVWRKVAISGDIPFPREAPAAIFSPVRDKVLVFGGFVPTFPRQFFNDVWELSVQNEVWKDISPNISPSLGSGRVGHTAIFHPARNEMVVFGGFGSGIASETWAQSQSNSGWSELFPLGQEPRSRIGHSAIYDPVRDRMIIFGGFFGCIQPDCWSNDTWTLSFGDTLRWEQMLIAGLKPKPRTDHSAVYDPVRDEMIIFGGEFEDTLLNDLWALSLSDTGQWVSLEASGGLPAPRAGHTAIYDERNGMVIFGGRGEMFSLNETWKLDLDQATWRQIIPGGSVPAQREGHTAIHDVPRDRMIIFGGTISDIWEFSLSTVTWRELFPAGRSLSRVNHSAIYDPPRNRMIVYGGHDEFSRQSDTWALGWDQSTPVTLAYFNAHWRGEDAVVTWLVLQDVNHAGFHLYRQWKSGERKQLTKSLLFGQRLYEFVDQPPSQTETSYWLAELGRTGTLVWYGPATLPVQTTRPTFFLSPGYPNPFHSETRIDYSLPGNRHVKLSVHDLQGRRIVSLVDKTQGEGDYTTSWDGRINSGKRAPSGIYFVRLRAGNSVRTRKLILIR